MGTITVHLNLIATICIIPVVVIVMISITSSAANVVLRVVMVINAARLAQCTRKSLY